MTTYKDKSHRGAPCGTVQNALRRSLQRILLAAIILIFGSGVMLAQTDYSGTYYIRSESANKQTPGNYYICPTEGWAFFVNTSTVSGTDNGQPFLTTHHMVSGSETKYRWIIQKSGNYYTIKYAIDYNDGVSTISRYMSYSRKLSGAGVDRLRVHLEKTTTPGDNELFSITTNGNNLVIAPKNTDADASNTQKYLVVNGGNKDSFIGESGKADGPSNYTNTAGIIGTWNAIDDANAPFAIEDIIERPTIAYNSSNLIEITSSVTGNIYYTTDGTTPTASSTLYSAPFDPTDIETDGMVVIKAIVVRTSDVEVSNATTFTTVKFGNSYPYLVQSQENTNYYMIPVTDTNNADGFTKTITTSLCQPSMMWYFENAGITDGVQYFFMVNKNTGQYVYYHVYNSNKYSISLSSGEEFAGIVDDADKDPYRFSITLAAGGGVNICPKNAPTRCIYKGTSNKHNGYINANTTKTNALGRWALISVPEQKMPAVAAPVTISTSETAFFYTFQNELNTGYYIHPDTYVTTTNSVTDNDKWYFLQADKDDWLTYYHIVNAVSGEYLYLMVTGTNAANAATTRTMADGLEAAEAAKYQFVLAPTTTDGNYYLIPRSMATQKTRSYTSLSTNNDTSVPLRTLLRRYWNDSDGQDASMKWTIEEADLTACQDPVFSEEEGLIQITGSTIATKICYTTDGSTPTAATETVFTDATELQASSQYLIKAIAVQKNNTSVVSNVVTLYNKPDITLSQDTYTYDRTAHEPTVSKVAITINETEYAAATTPTPTYAVDSYTNNTNAGTATVTITDNDPSDNIFFANATTTFTITPVSLTIVADATSKGYGDSDPALTYTPTGIAAGDDVADVLSGVLARAAGENVGTYAISQGTLESVSTNYTIGTFTPANFTITQKSIGNGTIPAAGITCNITRNNDDSFTVTVNNNGNAMTVGTSGTDYDYSLSTSGDASTKYYEVEATGANNYTGSFTCKYANAPFGTHDATNYSATFITDATGDEDFATPAGMTACIITDVDVATGVVTVETLDYIPENVPVVLLSDHAATGFFIQPRVGGIDITSSQVSSNLLAVARGDAAARTFAVAEIYLLYKDEFVLNTAGTLPAERVYLPVADIGGAPAKLGIDWDCITGITTPVDPSATTVPVGFANGIWYTLDGRRICGRPTQRGLYISNGQKVVVK